MRRDVQHLIGSSSPLWFLIALLLGGCAHLRSTADDPAFNPVGERGGPTRVRDMDSAFAAAQKIAWDFRQLPRPLITSVVQHPEEQATVLVWGFDRRTEIHKARTEPILNSKARAFIRDHSALEIQTVLWPYEEDPLYAADCYTLVASTNVYQHNWPEGCLSLDEVQRLQAKGRVARGQLVMHTGSLIHARMFGELNRMTRPTSLDDALGIAGDTLWVSSTVDPYETRNDDSAVDLQKTKAVIRRLGSALALLVAGPQTRGIESFSFAAAAMEDISKEEIDLCQRAGETRDQWDARVSDVEKAAFVRHVRSELRARLEAS